MRVAADSTCFISPSRYWREEEMATTPRVADCQSSLGLSSATETLKLLPRRSFRLRRTWRRSLRECASSMRSSRLRYAMGMCAGRGECRKHCRAKASPWHEWKDVQGLGERRG